MLRRLRPFATAAMAACTAGVLAGCVTTVAASAPGSPTPGVVVDQPQCRVPEVLADLGLRPDEGLVATPHPTAPVADVAPAGFTAVGVLECAVGGRMRDGAGTWTAVTATSRDGAPDDVTAVIAALAEPAPKESCHGEATPLALWLLDAMGRGVRMRLPLDACGAVSRPVRDALDQLTTTGVRDEPVARVPIP